MEAAEAAGKDRRIDASALLSEDTRRVPTGMPLTFIRYATIDAYVPCVSVPGLFAGIVDRMRSNSSNARGSPRWPRPRAPRRSKRGGWLTWAAAAR